MNIIKSSVMLAVIATAVYAGAEAPVAVRVEVESLEVRGEGTEVALTVQVSPEDRSRIGKNAMVRITLDGDVPPGQSPLWAVRIEGDGSGRVETLWPPGEHALRVEISSPNGQHTGLWVGTVRIPGATSESAASEELVEPQKPAPVPTSVPGQAPAAEMDDTAAAAAATAAAPEAPAAVEEPVETAEALDEAPPDVTPPDVPEVEEVAMPDAAPVEVEETAAPIEPPEPEPETAIVGEEETETIAVSESPETAPAPEVAEETVAIVEVAEEEEPDRDPAKAAVAGGLGAAAATEPETSTETTPAPAPPADPEPAVVPEQAPVEPEAAVVEPLRADTAPPNSEQGPASSPAPDEAADAAQPPPAEVAAAFEEWADADPATVDLTVVVLRDHEAATGLTAADFSVRIDRKDAVVEKVGGADRAPLQLGVAVDVAAGSAAGWSQSGGRLFPLVQRARGGRGHVFFAADGSIGAWDAGPGEARTGSSSVSAGGLTSMIIDSLARFEGRRGRAFLVVVTDGSSDADKAAWKAANDAATDAGVPVLVIALWDEKFNDRIRRNLKAIGESSGGGLFLVQGSDQLNRAAERFGPMIDAGVALRLLLPPGVTLPAQVSVQATEKSLEVTAPKGVR